MNPQPSAAEIQERAREILRQTSPSPPPASSPGPAAAPRFTDPIPARKLNEFVYCPRLFYYEKEVLDEVRVIDLSHIALFGNIQISTQAIQTLCEAGVPVTYFSMGGWFYGLMLDSELALLYGVETGQFNRAMKRNAARFPADFAFRLTLEEWASLRCQIGTLKTGGRGQHRKYLPQVFTEHGAIMAAPS